MRIGILTSHPIQYQAPWFRALARVVDLQVFFTHRQTPAEQAAAGFGVGFDWDVDLLSGYSHRFLENKSRRPGVNRFSGCDTPEIRSIIRQGNYDGFVVTGWHLKSYWQAVRACRRVRVPVLVRGDSQLLTPRSMLKRAIKAVGYRIMLYQFDGFLVVGQRAREYLVHYGVGEDRMFFAPHFVDNEWFALRANETRGARHDVRARWGADEKTLVALFVGKFQRLKRAGDILSALALLKPRGIGAAAVFVGAGELDAELRAQVARENIHASFVGFKNQSELPACYASADVLVLPSDSETWGLVVNEAMACGLPAVVSDAVGCAPDLIEEGKTGFTFPVGNVAELADRLARLAAMKREGHDFRPALTEKMRIYSVETAGSGTMQAIEALKSRQRACRI